MSLLKAAHEAAGSKTEEEELAELQGMIGGVPKGMYIKLQQAQKNRDLADRVRKEREELEQLKAQRATELKERMEALRIKRETKQEASRLAHQNKIKEQGARVREEVLQLERQRDDMKAAHWKEARVRVEHANNLDERLDASEAAQDQKERDDAAAAKKLWKEQLQAQRDEENRVKSQLNEKVRKGRERRDQSQQQHAQTKRNKTAETKQLKSEWNSKEQNNKQAHLMRSKQLAQKRAAERQRAKEINDAKAEARRQAAREEKANNAVATAALDDEIRRNQLMRARSYAKRYVPTEAVESMEASDTFRRLYGLTDANGQIKTVTRESLAAMGAAAHSPSKA